MDQANFIPEDAFSIAERGLVVTGGLGGTLQPGMRAVINGIETEVAGIEIFRKSSTSSIAPMSSQEKAVLGSYSRT